MTRSSPAPAPHSMKKLRRPGPSPQRGAAALIVVLLLFFIISLVAAYAGRNLIFEQRTSTNQYRATQAFEAAEAGLEWAVAMLNGGRVTADCIPPDPVDVAQPSFRQRYVEVDVTGFGQRHPGALGRRHHGRKAELRAQRRRLELQLPRGRSPDTGDTRRRRRPPGVSRLFRGRRPAPARRGAGGLHRPYQLRRPALRRTWRRHRRRGRRDRERGRRVEQCAWRRHRAPRSPCAATECRDPMRCGPLQPSARISTQSGCPMDRWPRGWRSDNWRNLTPSNLRGTPIEALVARNDASLSRADASARCSPRVFAWQRRTTSISLPRCVLNDCAVACSDELCCMAAHAGSDRTGADQPGADAFGSMAT